MVPEGYKYASTHEWCRVEKEIATIGVTEYAIKDLGDISYVELPDEGDDVLTQIPFGELEGRQAVKDLLSPFDGIVVEINARVAHNPDILKSDPYDKGWLIRLRLERPVGDTDLLSASDYERIIRQRKRR